MMRKALQLAVFFTASLAVLPAQEESRVLAAVERSGLISGIPVSSIAGAPFSATAVIELQYEVEDEDPAVLRTINLLARDSKGRTRKETRRLMPESFHGSPQVLAVRLYDPETHVFTIYDPVLHIARRQVVPEQANTEAKPIAAAHKEDLGASTIDGLSTRGTRVRNKLSAKVSGTGYSVETELEEWYSEELHLDLLVRYTDPRLGTETIGISNLKREEPSPSSFEIPRGYKIVDVAPGPSPESPGKDAAAIAFTH